MELSIRKFNNDQYAVYDSSKKGYVDKYLDVIFFENKMEYVIKHCMTDTKQKAELILLRYIKHKDENNNLKKETKNLTVISEYEFVKKDRLKKTKLFQKIASDNKIEETVIDHTPNDVEEDKLVWWKRIINKMTGFYYIS